MAELDLASTPAGTPGVVDGGARDQRLRQLAAISSAALAQPERYTRASERILGVPHPSTAKRPPRLEDGKCELLCSLHWLCSASCASRRIIDGDTLAIGSTKIRLEGIDAPETDQFCLNVGGVRWTCGIAGSSRAGGSPRRSTDQLQSQAVSTPTSERSPPASSRASSGWVLLGWRRKRKVKASGT